MPRAAFRSAASFNRQRLPSNFNRCPWCMRRSSSGGTTTTSPSRFGQSSMMRFDVIIVAAFFVAAHQDALPYSKPLQKMPSGAHTGTVATTLTPIG